MGQSRSKRCASANGTRRFQRSSLATCKTLQATSWQFCQLSSRGLRRSLMHGSTVGSPQRRQSWHICWWVQGLVAMCVTAGMLEHDKAIRLSGRQAYDNMFPAHLLSHCVDSIAEREGIADTKGVFAGARAVPGGQPGCAAPSRCAAVGAGLPCPPDECRVSGPAAAAGTLRHHASRAVCV